MSSHDPHDPHERRAGDGHVGRRVTVGGRVQGVSFRWSLARIAGRHGVVGWVVNLDDGRVDAWLEGPPDAVEAVEAWMVTGGPPDGEVVDVAAHDVDPAGHGTFEIRR